MKSHNIVSMPVSDAMYEVASKMADELGVLRNSITSGKGNLAGFIGEVALAEYFRIKGLPVSHNNTYDFDLTVESTTVDVKTKRCTSPPRPSYECSVANFNTTQKCDRYVFTRVDEKASVVYLLGWIDKLTFKEVSVFHKKGETDTNMVKGKPFKFHADCWNIRIAQLKPFKGLSK